MEKKNPNLTEERQDMDLKPIVFGPPRYGSPDPQTNRTSLNAAVDSAEPREPAEEPEPKPKAKKTTTKKDD